MTLQEAKDNVRWYKVWYKLGVITRRQLMSFIAHLVKECPELRYY